MHIVIVVLFAIGLILVRDPAKLPYFLQIIRHGLIVSVRWILRITIVGGVIWGVGFLCVKAYDKLTEESRKREEAIALAEADSLAKVETAEKQRIELAEEHEQYIQDSISNAQYALTEAKLEKQKLADLLGSWSRSDKSYISIDDIGIFTFKGDGSFFTSTSETGKYKYVYKSSILYLYYSSGKAESFNIESLGSNELAGKNTQDENIKVLFLKRPSTEKEPQEDQSTSSL